MRDGESRQPEEGNQDHDRHPAHPGGYEPRGGREEQAGHHRQHQPHRTAEVVGVDGEQGKEEEIVEAVAAAGQEQQREHDEKIHRERPAEDEARGAGIHGDQRQDAGLVGGEPEHEGKEVEAIARAQRGQAEGGQTTDHDHSQQEGEQALVPLEQAEDGGPWVPRQRRHTLFHPPDHYSAFEGAWARGSSGAGADGAAPRTSSRRSSGTASSGTRPRSPTMIMRRPRPS